MSKRYPAGILRKTPQTPSQTSAQGVWNMTDVTQAQKSNTWPIAGVPDPMSRSLRFRRSASASLTKTLGSPTSQNVWTWSGWIKISASWTDIQPLFYALQGNPGEGFYIRNDTYQLQYNSYDSGGANGYVRRPAAVMRDPAAWYHIVVTKNGPANSSLNNVQIYINGVQTTVWSANTFVGTQASVPDYVNKSGTAHYFGQAFTTSFYDGYMAEVNFIDGQALTPSSFGGTDQYGVWQARPYTGTYGTNGFYLPFKDTTSTTTLCYDYSGNSNNWTPNNISLTSGATYDSMVDVPTQWIPYNTTGDVGATVRGNYSVANPLMGRDGIATQATFSNGNLTTTHTPSAYGTFAFSSFGVSSGKYYVEISVQSLVGGAGIGIDTGATRTGNYSYVAWYQSGGTKYVFGSSSSYGSSWTTGDVIGIALDMTAGTVTCYKNNVSQGVLATGLTGTYFIQIVSDTGSIYNWNFGQQPFVYTPPAGYVTLNTFNLPASTIQQGNLYMDAALRVGGNNLTSLNFQPDFVWEKPRNLTGDNELLNSVVGSTKILQSNTTAAESTAATYITGFTSNGFTVGATDWSSSYNLVDWCWKAGGGGGSTNTNGSITSTVSVNPTAGFSIVTYTGNSTAGATVGHGLGVAPSMIITKQRNGTDSWNCYHVSLGNTQAIFLNQTATPTVASSFWNNTTPSSSVITLGNSGTNQLNVVAYCWAQIAGFSAFGSYTGNGSADGPFIYTGFRPKFVMTKCSSTTGEWVMLDTSRSPYNAEQLYLYADASSAEAGSFDVIDGLSNGFKVRSTWSQNNTNGATYIYMAFAENPFKNALAR